MDKQTQHGGPAFPKAGIELEKDANGSDQGHVRCAGKHAYAMADAMLKARNA